MGNALKDRLAQYFTPYKPQSVAEAAEKFMGNVFGQRPGMTGGGGGGFMPMTPVGARPSNPTTPATPATPETPATPATPETPATPTGTPNVPYMPPDTIPGKGVIIGPQPGDPIYQIPNNSPVPVTGPGSGAQGGNRVIVDSMLDANGNLLPQYGGSQYPNGRSDWLYLTEQGTMAPYSGTQNRNNKPFNPHDDFTIK